MSCHRLLMTIVAACVAACCTSAAAEIVVGVTLSATGPAASLGIPEQRTFAVLPATLGGESVRYVVLDDGSDPTRASQNARKLVQEHHADVLVGSSVTPPSLAIIDVAAEAETPYISMASSAAIVSPMDARRHWVFKVPQSEVLMAEAVVEHMKSAGIKSVGYLGFANPYGETWSKEFRRLAEGSGMRLTADERYAPSDTSVAAQVLKILGSSPDAVLIAAAGTPGATPHIELVRRGYKGRIYQTHGVANADFLRVGGKEVEGAILPASPVLVFEQLDDGNPVKKASQEYIARYEQAYGSGSRNIYGSNAWDAYLLLKNAVAEARRAAAPGTPAFRRALRAALEASREVVATQGVFSMSPTDHNGLDKRARVMVRVEQGKWILLK